MSLEQIRRVKEAEEQAESIRKESAEEAKLLIQKANQRAAQMVEEAKTKGAIFYKEMISKTQTEAQLTYDDMLKEADKQGETILSAATDKFDDAITAILRRVVRTSGDS
jgi:vacuolar-type H+-ATPase subunit H